MTKSGRAPGSASAVACLFEDSAHFVRSGPSHRHLRHRFAITCCRRAPPPSRVRGWTRLSEPTANLIAPPLLVIAIHPVQHPALEGLLRGGRAPNGRFRGASGARPCTRTPSTRGWCTRWSFQKGIGGKALHQNALHEGLVHPMVVSEGHRGQDPAPEATL